MNDLKWPTQIINNQRIQFPDSNDNVIPSETLEHYLFFF